jgi:hypothetical protein
MPPIGGFTIKQQYPTAFFSCSVSLLSVLWLQANSEAHTVNTNAAHASGMFCGFIAFGFMANR